MAVVDTGDRTAVLLTDAREVARSARRHKRLATYHRRRAREDRARLADLERRLALMGVRLVIPGEAPEEERHGRLRRDGSAEPS